MRMHCAICRYPLESWINDDGHTFVHPEAVIDLDTYEMHVPVPVPSAEIVDPLGLCDLCTSPHITWAYVFAPVTVADIIMDGDWGLCDPCAAAVDSGSVDAVYGRGRIPFVGDVDDADLEPVLRPLYAALLETPPQRQPIGQAIAS